MQKKRSVKMIMLIGYLLMAAGLFSTSILPSSAPAGMWFTYGTLLESATAWYTMSLLQ